MSSLSQKIEEKCKSIVIIGNGMDLSCKLESTYSDFFNDRYDEKIINYFKGQTQNIRGLPKYMLDEYNLLDFVLLSTIKVNGEITEWNDIESEILNILSDDYSINISKLVRQYISIKRAEPQTTSQQEVAIRNRIVSCLITQELLPNNSDTRKDATFYIDMINNELVKSINTIEDCFKTYLKDKVINSSYYKENLEQIYNYILDGDLKSGFIINFNYTDELSDSFYEIEHVHGSLNNDVNVIFGIDESQVDLDNMFAYRLSKTYRKIELDSVAKNEIKKMPKNIEQIIFFGHSLSEADYAYFQSIFDYYNIYDSEVDLIFYYKNYSDQAFSHCLEAITKLIKRYGDTLDNKDHGKNLLHKLSLECRLKVKEIQIDYDENKFITSVN